LIASSSVIPDFAISEGLVVTPDIIPHFDTSSISLIIAVSANIL